MAYPRGLIHAIGAGCTIIEVQEPTDFTIQPERWCGDYHISYDEEFIGIQKDVALDAINYDIYGAAAKEFAKVSPKASSIPKIIKRKSLSDMTIRRAFRKSAIR